MAILGEAIVAPKEIMKYFGTGLFTARECDLAYGATHMALQWDALATGDTRVMLAAQHEILQKPYGTTWITYTRCHDDIGLGYEDYMIQHAGFSPFQHRQFLMEYYSGVYPASPATGALFSVNPKTNDARISGSLASLCGLEKALLSKDGAVIDMAIGRILMMQAHSFFRFFWEFRGILDEGMEKLRDADAELYERLLGLKEPWEVKAVKMDVEGRRVEVEVECAERTIWAESGRETTASHSWLGKKELAASGYLGFCHRDYGGGCPGQGRERADRNGGCAVGREVQPLYTHF